MNQCKGTAPLTVVKPIFVTQSNKILKRELEFMDCVRPMKYFLRILGLMPYTIVRAPNGNILESKVKKWDVFRFLLSICVYLSCAFVSFKYGKMHRALFNHSKYNTHIYQGVIAHNLHTTWGVICCILFVVMDMWNRNKIVDLFKKFTVFDKEVNNFTNVNSHSFSFLYKI